MKTRKSNRLQYFDYSQNGLYFVTICTKIRINHFGEVLNGEMVLNNIGEIVKKQWLWLHDQYKYVKLHTFVIMPNHFHGILEINKSFVGTGSDLSLQTFKVKPLSQLIRAFKTTSSKLIHLNNMPEFLWQRSFYDRIIRTENELIAIEYYMNTNPIYWQIDIENKTGDHKIETN